MPPSRRALATKAALAGLGFTAVEVALGMARAHPLDPLPDPVGSALAAVALAALLAGVAAAIGRAQGPGLALAAWALVWGPHAARQGDLPTSLGWLPAPVIALASNVSPPLGIALGVAGAVIAPAARWTRPVAAHREGDGRSVLLVTVDTARADADLLPTHLPGEGWQRSSLAIAPAPWTLPSMLSLFTGRPVAEHGGGLPAKDGVTGVIPGLPWLPSRFRDAGYATVAVVSNPHLRGGFARGFDVFLHSDDSAEPLVLVHEARNRLSEARGLVPPVRRERDVRIEERALAEIRRDGGPRLVWVHLLGPHEYARAPDDPPAGWRPGTEDPAVLAEAYAGNVAVARERVARLVSAADGWVVAVTSDHGEAMGEGGHSGHGLALEDAELRVPLAIRGVAPTSGQVAVADLGEVLLAAARGESAALPSRPEVPVGGVRADPTAFAVRRSHGVYVPVEPPGQAGPVLEQDERTRAALEALGYQ